MKRISRIFLILIASLPLAMLGSAATWAETLAATIFSFDGTDFVRTNTTLMDKGQSATNTKLDHSSAAYKALIGKHSFSGPVTVFGKEYDSRYAPLISEDGRLSGALFVGIPK